MYLDNNKIKHIPESITGLTSLENLSLRNNYITSVPEVIGCLPLLWRADLTGNNISNIPSRIGNLTFSEYKHLHIWVNMQINFWGI